MYWEVHPGEATVSDVRRLVVECMDSMPRRIRVAVSIVDPALTKTGGWATMRVTKYNGPWGKRKPVAWRITIPRRSLFLPRTELVNLIKHEIGHGLLIGVRHPHGAEFRAFCKRHGMSMWIPSRDCRLATLRWRTWKRGDYVHQVTASLRVRVSY